MTLTYRVCNPWDKEVLAEVRTLMEEAFPPSERRSWEDFEALLSSEPRFSLHLFFREKRLVGFLTLWDMDSFLFGEHFALFPNCRGEGLGAFFLDMICTFAAERRKPLIIEVERPETPLALRRLNFYRRNGFQILSQDYIQPSYGAGRPEVPMFLLGTELLTEELIPHIVSCVKREVYRVQ